MRIGKWPLFKRKRQLRGFVDQIIDGWASGWACDLERPSKRLTLEFYIAGQCVGRALADIFREDLLTLRYGDGGHAFRFKLPLDAPPDVMVAVRVAKTDFWFFSNPIAARETATRDAAPLPVKTIPDIADFLFPRDLRITETNLSKCLIVGSCMSQAYVDYFRLKYPAIVFDHVLFNNLSDIPRSPPAPAAEYDFQFVQIASRSIIGDVVVKYATFANKEKNREIIEKSQDALRLMLDSALKYNREYGIVTFVQNFVAPQISAAAGLVNRGTSLDFRTLIQALNETLVDHISLFKNVYLIDAEMIAGSMGKRYFLDDTFSFFTHGAFWYPEWVDLERPRLEPVPPLESISTFHLDQFLDAIWRALDYNHRVIQQIDSVKLVIFDLDDTLWRGLIGEDYGDGQAHPAPGGWAHGVHEAIQHLRARGILLAICSKNNADLVKKRWTRAVPLEWITLEDFISAEIGWDPKVEGVERILTDTNLTARNVVFIDDNPVERAAILSAFPGIRVMGANPFQTRRILLNAPETQVRLLTNESLSRDKMVRKQKDREKARKSLSREEFLRKLKCRVQISEVRETTDARFDRAFELLNKTNQFNTTGRRWTMGEIENHFQRGGRIIAFSAEDKFTTYGIVGVILTLPSAIAQFVMSCRILGLEIESSVLGMILRDMRVSDAKVAVTASIIETEANAVCRDVYARSGFRPSSDGWFIFDQADIDAPAGHLSVQWERTLAPQGSISRGR